MGPGPAKVPQSQGYSTFGADAGTGPAPWTADALVAVTTNASVLVAIALTTSMLIGPEGAEAGTIATILVCVTDTTVAATPAKRTVLAPESTRTWCR